jgi:hypothetical protein
MQFERFYILNDSIVGSFPHWHQSRISVNSPKSGETSVVVTVWVCFHIPIHNCLRCSNTVYMYDINVRCSLKGSTASAIAYCDSFHIYIIYDFSQLSHIWGNLCGGNSMNVLSYAHPQLFKVFKHLIYVRHRCGMQFERFYPLNDSVVGSFPHLHHIWFQRTFPNLGKPLWW